MLRRLMIKKTRNLLLLGLGISIGLSLGVARGVLADKGEALGKDLPWQDARLLAEVLERVPLDRETKAVLLGQPSLLRPVYQLLLAHESGEWGAASQLSTSLNLDPEQVAGFYWRAQEWAREVSGA